MAAWLQRYRSKKALKELKHHIKHKLHVDDDILTAHEREGLTALLAETEQLTPNTEHVMEKISSIGERFRELVPKKSFATLREYADVLAVAMVVAFAIRALFLQPFKIPTSSMQPTLFGIHYISGDNKRLRSCPALLQYPLYSARRAELTVKKSGYIDERSIHSFNRYLIFDYTAFDIADITYTLPGSWHNVESYLHFPPHHQGEIIAGTQLCNGWLSLGDHLFVDRYSILFCGLKRGDVVVFNTSGIVNADGIPLSKHGFYYIKRLIGMPGDTLRIAQNTLYVQTKDSDKFVPVYELDPRIKKIYSGLGGYQGHRNRFYDGTRAPYLGNPDTTLVVPKDHYFMLGDNSLSSADSRVWGFVPRCNIVGKAAFIFWPFSRRWGRVDHTPPLPVKTGPYGENGITAMELQ